LITAAVLHTWPFAKKSEAAAQTKTEAPAKK
jgi:hypothetical protein